MKNKNLLKALYLSLLKEKNSMEIVAIRNEGPVI
jgi:hypothetical protein